MLPTRNSVKFRFQTKLGLSISAILMALSVGLFTFVESSQAAPGINQTMSFQGKLTNTNGTNVSDGSYSVVFSLYTVSSSGSAIWTETQNITATSGIIRANLGSVNSLSTVDFNQDTLYLGIKVGTDPEMSPRILMNAAAYAFNAKQVNGLSVTNNGGNTLNIASGKTLTIGNTLGLSGTDGTTFTLPTTSDTLVGLAAEQTLLNKTLTDPTISGSLAVNQITSDAGLNIDGPVTLTGSDTFTKLPNLTDLPPNWVNATSFSPDGQYLSVGHSVSPYLTIYKRTGDTFTKLPNPTDLPPDEVNSTSFSPDGQYLSVGHWSSPFLTIYKRTGDTFTKLPNPTDLPIWTVNATSFSPDGQYLSVGHYTSPFLTIYKRTGDTFTKLPDPTDLPPNTAWATSFSPDGQYLSVGHASSPYLTIYKRSGDTFTKLPNPTDLPPDATWATSFSPDGQYLSVGHDSSPFLTIYKRTSGTLTADGLIKSMAMSVGDGGLVVSGDQIVNGSSTITGQLVASGGLRVINGNGEDAAPTRSENGEFGFAYTNPNGRLYFRANDTNFYINDSGTGDYSEYFLKSDPQEDYLVGTITSLDTGRVRKAQASSPVLGIVSAFGTRGNDSLDGDRHLDNNYTNVGLMGQLPVLVSSEQGPINIGQKIGHPQAIPGVGVKAEENQSSLAIAMQSFNPGPHCPAAASLDAINWPAEVKNHNPEELCFTLPSGVTIGRIMVYISSETVNAQAAQTQALVTAMGLNSDQSAISTDLGMVIGGTLEAQGALIVGGNAEFRGPAIFKALAEFVDRVIFRNNVTFEKDVQVAGTLILNNDTAGLARINPGQKSVRVTFKGQYQQAPVVNTSLNDTTVTTEAYQAYIASGLCDLSDGPVGCQDKLRQTLLSQSVAYIIKDVSPTGFTVEIKEETEQQLTFSWTALMVKDPQTVQAD